MRAAERIRTPPSTATRRIPLSLMMAWSLPARSGRGRSCGRGRFLRAPVMQRPAAERRKAGAEDHAGIDVIGVGQNLVGKDALTFVEHGLDQLAAETDRKSVV